MRSSELKVGEAYFLAENKNLRLLVRSKFPQPNKLSDFQVYKHGCSFLVVQELEGGNLLEVLMPDGIRWFYRSSTSALNFLPA